MRLDLSACLRLTLSCMVTSFVNRGSNETSIWIIRKWWRLLCLGGTPPSWRHFLRRTCRADLRTSAFRCTMWCHGDVICDHSQFPVRGSSRLPKIHSAPVCLHKWCQNTWRRTMMPAWKNEQNPSNVARAAVRGRHCKWVAATWGIYGH